MRLSRNLTTQSVECRCGCGRGSVPSDTDPSLVALYEEICLRLVTLPSILSGHRCQARNEYVGGACDSPHLYGLALDLDVSGEPLFEEALEIIEVLTGTGGVGADERRGMIHIDTAGRVDTALPEKLRRPNRRWRYENGKAV